jgi:hypothetical protein
MNHYKFKLGLLTLLISPLSSALCLVDNFQDTQTANTINTKRNLSLLDNQIYHEPQFGSIFGELEHSNHSASFKFAWPATEKILHNVPSNVENSASGGALFNKLSSAASSTLEVLGPVGDAVAVSLWTENMLSTFNSESATNLDKAASVFSILPLVGDELNAISSDIKYFAAKQKIAEFEQQEHYAFSNFSQEFVRLHHKKEDAIFLIKKYDKYLDLTTSMYIDQLLLVADTEFRRLAAAYDRQLAKKMARIDLELFKTVGHISIDASLHQPLCHDSQTASDSLMTCLKELGPTRIDHLVKNLGNPVNHQLSVRIFKAKHDLVKIALFRLEQHRINMINDVIVRAEHYVRNLHNSSAINRGSLLFQARKSGLREYAKANWNLDYLSEEQLKTATFEVRPARTCWGIPSFYPGGIQDSIDACKDSGALYDTYHISKDSELAELIHFQSKIDIGPYVAARVKEGWQPRQLKKQLTVLANIYVSGQKSNDIFQSLRDLLTRINIPSFQIQYSQYLESKGLDSSDPEQQKNWYQISRWYEYILTQRPHGNVGPNLTLKDIIQPIFEQTISAAFIKDVNYTIPYPSVYSAQHLRFFSPVMADIFDGILTIPGPTPQSAIENAVEKILQLANKAENANDLHHILGDLTLYAQIAQHQQSEVNTGTLSSTTDQLFATRLSPLHESYMLDIHTAIIDSQASDALTDTLWADLQTIKTTLQQGNLSLAINQLGAVVREDKFPLMPFINEFLLTELEQWIDLQITLEESAQ